jgi:hypothetical protein
MLTAKILAASVNLAVASHFWDCRISLFSFVNYISVIAECYNFISNQLYNRHINQLLNLARCDMKMHQKPELVDQWRDAYLAWYLFTILFTILYGNYINFLWRNQWMYICGWRNRKQFTLFWSEKHPRNILNRYEKIMSSHKTCN